ncbi:MAG: hypothetical protein PWR20_2280 [Bacteroidales bacterium]|jgi:RNA polymerase sigma-70 factor (ECF subfamily)|nr:hypothetical protein [Bacteroidales bacterium]MDN5329111.1 hypothetical protein [Bacteroidales bacterium]
MVQPGYTDDEVIKGCLAGKRHFQTMLYQKYARSLFAVCLRYSNNTNEAEDLLQEAFVKIFTSLKNYRGEGPLGAWLNRIVINTALSRFRKEKQSITVEMDEIPDIADEDSPDDLFTQLSKNHCQQILQFIQELPTGYRQVFNLYIFEGYNHKEIAQLLGITESTSRTQLHKAKLLLKERILRLMKPHK